MEGDVTTNADGSSGNEHNRINDVYGLSAVIGS
jgi:hypothetical protein